MAPVKLKYLSRDYDRHGNLRIYVRAPGQKKIRIRAKEGTPDFYTEYAAALAGSADEKGFLRPCTKAGSIGGLIFHYRQSGTFKALDDSTRGVRVRILDRLAQKAGEIDAERLEARHVKKWRDAPEGPEAGNSIVKVLRQVLAVAVEDGLLSRNVAMDVKYRKSKPGGFTPWAIEDVQAFVKRHPPGTMAHKALCLFLFTGQRLSDIRRMGPQHECEGKLVFTQHKGRNHSPKKLKITIISPLRAALDATPSNHLAYITSTRGLPFGSDKSFGNRFSKWCREAGIEGKSAHGIRKGLGDILASIGLTAHQIMAILGHSSLKEAERYTRQADRDRLASEGMALLAEGVDWGKIVPLAGDTAPPTRNKLQNKEN